MRGPGPGRTRGQRRARYAVPAHSPNPHVVLHWLVVRTPITLGETTAEFDLRARAQVPAGHKIAARAVAAGEEVKKYDMVIGVASRDLVAGDYVHSHNPTLIDSYRDPDPDFCRTCGPWPTCPKPSAPRSWLCARRRPRRHAQLRRPSVVGELLVHGDQAHRRAPHAQATRGLSQHRRRGCLCADQPLRYVLAERAPRRAASRAGRLCTSSQLAGVPIVGLGCERNQADPRQRCSALNGKPRSN